MASPIVPDLGFIVSKMWFESLPDGVLLIDFLGDMEFANAVAERLFDGTGGSLRAQISPNQAPHIIGLVRGAKLN